MIKPKYLFILIVIMLSGININAQLNLIPVPKLVKTNKGVFTFNNNTGIVSNGLKEFYVNQISECLQDELDFAPVSLKHMKSNFIELLVLSTSKELTRFLKRNNLITDFNPGKEGYILDVTPGSIKIIALSNAGLFYGIQTFKQLISANRTGSSLPCLTIYDAPDIPVRAWQDDISRGPIPDMEMLKEQIRTLSSYKLNFFCLYIEHVFKLEKHPGIAPKDGISKEQVKELSEYARQYHVTLIGSYQSFGHMEETLSHPDYKHLAENDHIISPTLDESYEFLNDVYQEIVPSFSGQYFNINCDETFGLGEGKSKAMVDSMGIDGVYIMHINKLNAMLEPYGKKILMWGDIIDKYPGSIEQLPQDITVLVWGYHAAEDFDYAIAPIAGTGLNFWVAPGISCWSNIYPDLKTAEINIFNFIRDGVKHNTTGVLNTSWDDDGLNLFQNNWHGFIWGAENCWNAPSTSLTPDQSNKQRKERYNHFNNSFDSLFYGLSDEKLTRVIHKFTVLKQSGIRDLLKNSRFFEPIFPIHPDYVMEGKNETNEAVKRKLEEIRDEIIQIEPTVTKNKRTIEYLKFAVDQVLFTLDKNILRIDIYNYLEEDKSKSKAYLKKEILVITEKARDLKEEYTKLWKQENRDWWLSENIDKFDRLIDDLENLEGKCIITTHNKLSEAGMMITMRSVFKDMPVYYTINSDTLTPSSTVYKGPVYINKDAVIKAGVITASKAYPVALEEIYYHKGIGKLDTLYSCYSSYHPSYDGGGTGALLDGKLGEAEDLRSGRWQGFSGRNIELEIDLDSVQTINSFNMGCYQNTFSWVILPPKIEIYVKNRKEDEYVLSTTIKSNIPPEEEGSFKINYKAEFENVSCRYIKVIAYYYGKLPEWHHAGSGYESMIFADEIILK